MPGPYQLLVGVYDAPADAVDDLRVLSQPGPVREAVAGAGLLHRWPHGAVLEQGGGGTLAFGAGTGAAAGVVAGVVLSVPLVAAAAGALVGAAVGHRISRREVTTLDASLGDAVPVGATAVVAVVPEARAGVVAAALGRARKVTGRVLDEGPLTQAAKGLVRGNPEATDALDAQRRTGR